MLVGCTLISDVEITEKGGVGVGGGDSGATDTDVDPDTIDGDGDGYTGIDGDCDDSDYTVSPGANEDCTTTADDNCDGITNDPEAAGCSDFFIDSDGDGFGNEEPMCLCAAEGAYVVTGGDDCDDEQPLSYPGNVEVCDDVDNDCDGSVDIGAVDALTFFADADADGFGDLRSSSFACTPPSSFVADATDCYDGNPGAYPGSLAQMDVDRGDGSYDYNCDGVESLEWPDLFACEAEVSYTFGWDAYPVPDCGGSGTLSGGIGTSDCTVTWMTYPQNCY